VQVVPKSTSDDYSSTTNGTQYQSIGSFDVPSAGSYTVEVAGPSGTRAKIGQISLGLFLGLLIGGIAVGAIGFVVALIILIVTIVRRSRIRRRTSGPATWSPPTGTPGVPPPAAGTIAPPPMPPTAPPAPPAPPTA
jgi:predicted lipid-binding transport protein (Tim44 family)